MKCNFKNYITLIYSNLAYSFLKNINFIHIFKKKLILNLPKMKTNRNLNLIFL